MKFKITLKDPDGFSDGISEAAEKSLGDTSGLSDSERESVAEDRIESIGEALRKWVEYGEYIEIEFDTEAGTATVVPQ